MSGAVGGNEDVAPSLGENPRVLDARTRGDRVDVANLVLWGIASVGAVAAVLTLVLIEVLRPRHRAPRLRLNGEHALAATQTLENFSLGRGDSQMTPGGPLTVAG